MLRCIGGGRYPISNASSTFNLNQLVAFYGSDTARYELYWIYPHVDKPKNGFKVNQKVSKNSFKYREWMGFEVDKKWCQLHDAGRLVDCQNVSAATTTVVVVDHCPAVWVQMLLYTNLVLEKGLQESAFLLWLFTLFVGRNAQ